jgi:hypothetical protein
MTIKKNKSFFFNQALFILWILAIALSWVSIKSYHTIYCDCSKNSAFIELIIWNLIFYLIPFSLECKKRKWIVFKKHYFVATLTLFYLALFCFLVFHSLDFHDDFLRLPYLLDLKGEELKNPS